jgi:hypothetical protein
MVEPDDRLDPTRLDTNQRNQTTPDEDESRTTRIPDISESIHER